jgi:8-oxo-dGTP pyrophosphatase MutT (NUDIX family)
MTVPQPPSDPPAALHAAEPAVAAPGAVVARRAARVLVLDRAGRLLLLHGSDPAEPSVRYWFTVGGGIDDGESPAMAAARELYEETGLRVPAEQVGEPVHHDVTDFGFDGVRYHQEQDFFVVRVDGGPIAPAALETYEHATISEYRWWSAAELSATTDTYYPPDLPALVRRLTGEVP